MMMTTVDKRDSKYTPSRPTLWSFGECMYKWWAAQSTGSDTVLGLYIGLTCPYKTVCRVKGASLYKLLSGLISFLCGTWFFLTHRKVLVIYEFKSKFSISQYKVYTAHLKYYYMASS